MYVVIQILKRLTATTVYKFVSNKILLTLKLFNIIMLNIPKATCIINTRRYCDINLSTKTFQRLNVQLLIWHKWRNLALARALVAKSWVSWPPPKRGWGGNFGHYKNPYMFSSFQSGKLVEISDTFSNKSS